jgi:lysophospholipase L1-like esterase
VHERRDRSTLTSPARDEAPVAAAIRMDGFHFNAKGHRLIGEHLAEYLLARDVR